MMGGDSFFLYVLMDGMDGLHVISLFSSYFSSNK